MSTQIFRLALAVALGIFLGACASNAPQFKTSPVPNPSAPMAFFGESNISHEMRMEYAVALQNSGLYNFVVDNISEEQIKEGVEIRLNYSEETGIFGGVPTLVLKAEFKKEGLTWFNFTIREKSDKTDLSTPLSKSKEKNYRKQVLLERFLEEVKRAGDALNRA